EPEQPTVPQQTAPLEPEQPTVPQQTGPLTDQTPGADQISPVQAPRQPPRTFMVIALPVLLTGATSLPLLAVAQEAGCDGQADTLAATATAAPEPTADSRDDDPTLLERVVDVLFGWLDDDSSDDGVAAQATPEPSPGPTPPPEEPCP